MNKQRSTAMSRNVAALTSNLVAGGDLILLSIESFSVEELILGG